MDFLILIDSDFSWDLHGLPSFFLASLSVLVDSFWVHLGFFGVPLQFFFFLNSFSGPFGLF